MRSSIWSAILMAGSAVAQGDIVSLLKSQPDLSTLLELAALVDGLPELLSSSSNITIFAPTNEAFAKVPRDVPEGEAIEYKNNTIAIGALLANHVFKGTYPAAAASDTPIFVQSLLDNTYIDFRQPFSNFTGGQYNGVVKSGADVCVLSGEFGISKVIQADIKLGPGITIHKVDEIISFGAPLQLFSARAGYTNFNAALGAAKLGIDFGLTGDDVSLLNISDFTVFVPTNDAFTRIGSVLKTAEVATLQDVLRYHFVPNAVLFSTSLGNTTVKTLQGNELTISVFPDGSAFVNSAKIAFTNNILWNGVAHVIDNVIAPGAFDRKTLNPSAPPESRLAFPSATPVSQLPFSSVSFAGDMTYTATPTLLQTLAAVPTAPAAPSASASASATKSGGAAPSASTSSVPVAAGAEVVASRALMGVAVVLGVFGIAL
ncbi:FAS1 domain-containing protein [Microdochium bolleyi]|uniref:FAS1 domain-containing protein n=1 Tax=Microdochium bolleyi TaxID=196109 RepID=A0A136IRE3_9PEZI|nr:FAS1 domain-containing protein [Microdochium bolleyi]